MHSSADSPSRPTHSRRSRTHSWAKTDTLAATNSLSDLRLTNANSVDHEKVSRSTTLGGSQTSRNAAGGHPLSGNRSWQPAAARPWWSVSTATMGSIMGYPRGRGLKRCEPLESRMTGNFQVRFGGGRMEKEPSNEPPRQPPTLLPDRYQPTGPQSTSSIFLLVIVS